VPVKVGEADQTTVAGVTFSHELADVELALAGDLRSSRIAEVRVVRPHDDLGLLAPSSAEVSEQGVEGLDHVLVAEVPRRRAPAEHRSVILLRVLHRQCVLLRVEELVRGHQAIAAGI
jgi:hypothetical protein